MVWFTMVLDLAITHGMHLLARLNVFKNNAFLDAILLIHFDYILIFVYDKMYDHLISIILGVSYLGIQNRYTELPLHEP